MSLSPGSRFGVYDIVAPLGAGGMGEVYRARDSRLKREIAIKVLPAAWAHNTDRVARFNREAEVLAALNHPNIAAIYGVEESTGVSGLLLELVEGPTLADRLARGPLPVADALAITRQLADALSAAHDAGIVHRDLKPANIKVRDDGTVKVLDFGLAKAAEPGPMAGTVLTTMMGAVTGAGVILGTAAYMSPEQARGQAVDKRTDIWAFGCVLFEMLTGRAVFGRTTATDMLAAILEREPDWTLLEATPDAVRRMLRRCLEKDPSRRLRDVSDARAYLDDALTGDAANLLQAGTRASAAQRRWRSLAVAATATVALTLIAVAVITVLAWRSASPLDTSSHRFHPFAAEAADESSPSWSPDGRSIAYVADVDNIKQLFTRSLDAAVAAPITRFSTDTLSPFWSPDGHRIYFISPSGPGRELWSVGATGGEPQLVMKDAGAATIARDGTLAFLRGGGGRRSLWVASPGTSDPRRSRVPPFPETFTRSDAVEFSRDGTKVAVLVEREERPSSSGPSSFSSELWIVPYPSGAPRRVLARARDATGGHISWLPDSRHIVLDSVFPDPPGSHLYLVDTENATIRPITSGAVEEGTPSVSPTGDTIAFAAGSNDFDLIRVPLDGSDAQTLLATARSETRPAWSPTGKSQLAYVTDVRGTSEIWVRNVEEGWARPVIKRESDGATWSHLNRPSFSPNGQRIVYEAVGARHAVWVSSVADGRGVPLDQESPDQHSPAWSPDGKWIAYQRLQGTSWELVKVLSGGGPPVRLAEAQSGGGDQTAWSPTGEWIAHVLGESLRLTTASDGKKQRSLNGPPPKAFGFSSDGSLLYAVRQKPDRMWELAEFDVQTGDVRRVVPLRLPPTATLTGFSLHPDAKSFATAIGIARHDIWLLEGFKLPSGWFRWF